MAQASLSTLPANVAVRVIEQLDLPSRLSLAQTSKSMRDTAQEAGRADLLSQSKRPGRISDDPFPTLFEHVQRGGKVHHRAMRLGNLLRACTALPAGDGLLQAAARRQLRARNHLENSAPVAWREGTYHGELDAQGRPHGVGRIFSHDPYVYGSIYLGDWHHGKRSGWGTQFFWTKPPGLWSTDDGDVFKLCAPMSQEGGWYEGSWENDKYSGPGLLVCPEAPPKAGLWRDGLPA